MFSFGGHLNGLWEDVQSYVEYIDGHQIRNEKNGQVSHRVAACGYETCCGGTRRTREDAVVLGFFLSLYDSS